MAIYNTIAESNNFIILEHYTKLSKVNEPAVLYQTERALEQEFIRDLENQGYEYLPEVVNQEGLLANAREQLQQLNNMVFADEEWTRFVAEYLDKPNDSMVDKTRKIHDDYIYDFVFDDSNSRFKRKKI
jgi:type I restriction enzyme R subunit